MSDRPIFLCGASRSGTALVRSLVNNDPDVHLAGETHYFDDLRAFLGERATTRLEGEWQRRAEDYFVALAHRPYGHGGVPEESPLPRERLRAEALALGGSGDAYFEAFCRIDARAHGASRWGEKTPRHIFRLPELLSRYPGAQAICMIRDGRAVVASYRDWQNQGGFDFEADPGHRETLVSEQERSQASYHPAIASMLWRSTVGAALSARRRFGEARVWIQAYEEFVRDPEKSARSLCDWLGIGFRPELLDVPMHNSSVSRYAASGGVSADPLERWRERLSPGEIAVIEHFCGSVLGELGYASEGHGLQAGALLRAYATLPLAVVRAARANRERIPSLPAYLGRRLRLMIGR